MEKKANAKILFAILSICMLAFGLQVGGFQMCLLSVATEYKLSNTLMGSMVTFQYIAIMIAPMVCGRLSDKFGRKRTLIVFSLVFLVGCACTLLISNVVGFIVGVFVIGAGASVCWGTISSAIADAFQAQASKYINLNFCFYSVGALISPQIDGYLMNTLNMNWRICYVVTLVGVAIATVLVLFLRFCPQPEYVAVVRTKEKKSGTGMLGSLIFVGLLLSMVCYCFIENGIGFFANVYFTDAIGNAALTGTALSAYWFMMIPARLIIGMFYKYRRHVLAFSFVGISALLIVLCLTTSGPLAVACIAIIGFIGGPIYSTLIGLGAEAFPKGAGVATGAIIAGSGLGGAISPFIMGVIADMTAVRSAYIVLAVFGILGAISFFAYIRKSKETPAAV